MAECVNDPVDQESMENPKGEAHAMSGRPQRRLTLTSKAAELFNTKVEQHIDKLKTSWDKCN